MRLTRVVPLAAALGGLVFGASACGSSTGANTITMTSAEISEVFAEMSAALSGTGVSLSQMPAGTFVPARAAANVSSSISVTANCPLGGTVGVSGSDTPGTSGASFNVTETANACQTQNFTVGGSFTINGSASTSSTAATFNETVQGSLDVTRKSGGQHGTCSFNFSVNGSVSLNGGTTTITAQGTICGQNASTIITG